MLVEDDSGDSVDDSRIGGGDYFGSVMMMFILVMMIIVMIMIVVLVLMDWTSVMSFLSYAD